MCAVSMCHCHNVCCAGALGCAVLVPYDSVCCAGAFVGAVLNHKPRHQDSTHQGTNAAGALMCDVLDQD